MALPAKSAQHPPGHVDLIDLPVSSRVDTTDSDVKEVYDLVRKFLSTRPDSMYDNPCWNDEEKEKDPEPYPARGVIYPSRMVITTYPPTVLSIEKDGDYYCARVIYYREGLKEPFSASNPWAIQRLYAKKVKIKKEKEEADSTEVAEIATPESSSAEPEKEKKKKDNKEYRLFDPLHVITQNWRHDRIGPIDYYYPQDYYLNRKPANSMVLLCKNMKGRYKVKDVEPISFYITRNDDELASILGLDFILNPTPGMSNGANAQVFSSLGNEYYPHEMAHVYFRDYHPHQLLSEGIATYIGGSKNKLFKDLLGELAAYLRENDTLTFQNFLNTPIQQGSPTYYYTVGGVLCRMARQKGGFDAVKQLLKSGQSEDELYQQIELVLGIKRDNITQALREKVIEYSGAIDEND